MPDGASSPTGFLKNNCAFTMAKKGEVVTSTSYGNDCAYWTAHLESLNFNSNTFQVGFSYYKTETDESKVTTAVSDFKKAMF